MVDCQIISAGTLEAGADLKINAEPVTKEEIGNVITAIKSLKKIEKRMDMITIAVFKETASVKYCECMESRNRYVL